MSLEKEKIIANAKKYFDTAKKLDFTNQEFTDFLGQNFIAAPASTMESLHNAFEGGLIDHLLRVASYAVKFNNALPESEQVNQNSLLKVCLLHQVGKANLYKPCTSEWHRKNQGKMYEFNEDLVSMRVSERSVYYALSHGIKFTEEESTIKPTDNTISFNSMGDFVFAYSEEEFIFYTSKDGFALGLC